MRITPVLLFALTAMSLVACQQGPDDTFDNQPDVQNLPKKIVEVEDSDSSVALFTWSADGKLKETVKNFYEDGELVFIQTGSYSYASNGLIKTLWLREKNMDTGEMFRMDEFFFHSNGKVEGSRIVDSADQDKTYWKYLYDSRGRLSRVLQEMDSVEYFESNPARYQWYDSLVYNSDDKLVESYNMNTNWATMSFNVLHVVKYKNLDTHPNYFPTGINNYLILYSESVLTGNNPGLVEYEYRDVSVSPVTGNIVWTTTYDFQNRPVKMTYVHNSPGGSGGFPVINNVTGSRSIYY